MLYRLNLDQVPSYNAHTRHHIMNPRIIKKTPIRIAFGNNIRQKRISLKLSQEQLAERANLHTNYIGSVERGERNISIDNIYKISNALGVHPRELLP